MVRPTLRGLASLVGEARLRSLQPWCRDAQPPRFRQGVPAYRPRLLGLGVGVRIETQARRASRLPYGTVLPDDH